MIGVVLVEYTGDRRGAYGVLVRDNIKMCI